MMTDLTAGGTVGMIDLKRMMERGVDTKYIADTVSAVWPDFSDKDREVLIKQALKLVERDVDLAQRNGVVFHEKPCVEGTQYPHQFSSWSLVVFAPWRFIHMIHDFSSTFPLTDESQTREIREGIEVARTQWH